MEPHSQPASLLLDGSWERSGRSLNTSAVLGLLGIGLLYFNGQSILAAGAMMISRLMEPGQEPLTDFFSSFRSFIPPLRIVLVVTQLLLMLLPTYLLVRRWHSSDVKKYVRMSGVSPVDVVFAVLITIFFIPAGNFVAEEFMRQLEIPRKLLELNGEIFTSRSPFELAWLVIVACATPAVCEETFFRGFVQRTFERTMSWKSVILVGVLFGLFHFNPLGLFTLSFLGMLLGYFFYRSRNLLPSMAAHFTNNLVAVTTLFQMSDGKRWLELDSIPLWLVVGTLPVGVGLLLLYHRWTAHRFPPESVSREDGTA